MARKKAPPAITQYYKAIQSIFRMQFDVLTGVLSHYGERGRNDEERCKDFLTKVLPKRFSVGTGFIVSSERSVPRSSQTDVVIFDEFYNSPLHRELAAFVYPVEIVYGTVEVKAQLTPKNLQASLKAISKIRKLGEHRWYQAYDSVAPNPANPTARVVAKTSYNVTTPPRAFIFAYGKKGWRRLHHLIQDLEAFSRDAGSHIHGLVVVDSDWYVAQIAHSPVGPKFMAYEGDALLRFVSGMVNSISSAHMAQLAIDRYLEPTVETRVVLHNTSPSTVLKIRRSKRKQATS